jgi:hypothetical protein
MFIEHKDKSLLDPVVNQSNARTELSTATSTPTMASQISTSAAIALISQLLYEIQALKGENNSIRLAYQELQHDSTQRDAIIDEQAKLLQSAGFGLVSNEGPAMPSFVESQLDSQSHDTAAFVEAPQLAAITPSTSEETSQAQTKVQNKKRKAATDSDKSNKKHHPKD